MKKNIRYLMKLFQIKCLLNVCQHSTNCDICQITKQNIKNSDVVVLLG